MVGDGIADEDDLRIGGFCLACGFVAPHPVVAAVGAGNRHHGRIGFGGRNRLDAHEPGDGRIDGLGPGLRAGGIGMEQVPQQGRVDGAVGTQEDVIDVHPEDVLVVGQFGGELAGAAGGVHFRLAEGEERRAGPFVLLRMEPFGEDPHEEDLGGRVFLADGFHDRLGAGENLLGRVHPGEMLGVGIVGADVDHEEPGRGFGIQFAVLQVPQDLLGAVAVVPEIDGLARGIILVPDGRGQRLVFAAEIVQGMRDGVADQHQIPGARADRLHLFRVAGGWTGRRKIRIARLGLGNGYRSGDRRLCWFRMDQAGGKRGDHRQQHKVQTA